jgi:hypothetical protein
MRWLALAAVALCPIVAPAGAEPITLQFTGTLTSVHPDVAHALSAGDPFEVTLTFENTPRSTSPFWVAYDASFSASIGGYDILPIHAGTGLLSSLRSDSDFFEMDGFGHLPGDLLPGDWGPRLFAFWFSDPTTPLGQLPTSVNPGATMNFDVFYTQRGPDGSESGGHATSGSATSIRRIPEPTTGLLLLLGLAPLGVRTLRKRMGQATRSAVRDDDTSRRDV